jgi:hypothetical protein
VVYAAAPSVKIVGGEVNSLAEPKVVNVLKRGDFEQPGDVAPPGALSTLKHSPARFVLAEPKNEAARRAALADWLAHPDNVLTWRSIVNRVWHYHFGRGLCDTPSDLGRMGGTPSHPELIDWLAVWFRDEAGGSLKKLHRLIVTSATYRQSSQTREGPAQADSDNRLLWRQNRQRLDADGFRDFTLATSGALNLKMGGPGIRQPRASTDAHAGLHFARLGGARILPAEHLPARLARHRRSLHGSVGFSRSRPARPGARAIQFLAAGTHAL